MNILFDGINLALFGSALFNLFLCYLMFFKGQRKKVNIIYGLHVVAAIFWILAMVLYRSAPQETAPFWAIILYISPTFIASIFLYFTYIFPWQVEKKLWWRILLIFGANLLLIMMITWPGLIIREVNIRPGLEKEIIFTPYYWLYFIYIASFFSYGFIRLFRKYLISYGLHKLQIIYLLSGYFISTNIAFITNLIMPWLGYFFLNWFGQVLTIIMVTTTTYAILRYRLMDIRVLARQIYLYFFTALFSYIAFYIIAWFYLETFGDIFHPATFLVGFFVAPAFVFFLYYFYGYLQELANHYFFSGLYSYQETITRLAYELNLFNDLEHIIDMIMGTFRQAVQLEKTALIVYIDGKESFRSFGFSEEEIKDFSEDKSLKDLLIGRRRILTVEDVYSYNAELAKRLLGKKISAVLPFFSAENLVALAFLGQKENRDAFTNEDLALLETLTNQAGTAISNAGLYAKIYDFNKTLSERVEEQTAELRAQAEHLKKLLAMRSEFLDIASHQLRTPVSVILGTISMFHEGSMDNLPLEKQQHFVNNIYIKAKKLEQIIRDILNASEMDTGEFIFTPQELTEKDLRIVIDEVIKDLKEKAEEKNLILNFNRPAEPLVAPINAEYLEQAIFNLVDNAIIYTKEGQVDISLLTEDDRAIIRIEDTGVGIPEEDRKNLFNKFSRGKKATDMYTDGSGLGLFISKKIVKGHPEGKIDFSSEVGQGTSFEIKLPRK